MASTVSKKRARRKSTSPRQITLDEARLKELMKEAVLEALDERDAEDSWDRQMREDVEAGRWDKRLAELREEIRQGKTAPLEFENAKLK